MSIILTLLAEIALFAILYYSVKKQIENRRKITIIIVLVGYLAAVFIITLGVRSFDPEVEVNLNLFSTYRMMFQRTVNYLMIANYAKAWQEFIWIGYVSWSCVILNILLFVPLGYLLPLTKKMLDKWYIVLMVGIGISAVIEVTQLLTHRGWLDVDDTLHNGVGTIIGWLCYRRWLCPMNNIKHLKRTYRDDL